MIEQGRLYVATPPLYGLDLGKNKMRFFVDNREYVEYVQSLFCQTNTIADIDSNRRVVVGRELTKLHEEITDGTSREVLEDYASRTKILGEFAIFISGNKNAKLSPESSDN